MLQVYRLRLFIQVNTLRFKLFFFFYNVLSGCTRRIAEVFLGKRVLKICSKFTGENPCRSAISMKLLDISAWLLSCKFSAYLQNTFSQEPPWMAAFRFSALLKS